MRILRIVTIGFFATYCIWKGFHPDQCCLLNGANLLIHEGGHPIFGVFGEYIGIWGGTLMQLLFPAVFVGYFLYHGQLYSASVVLCWFGQNFFHIANYLQDARAQELPLVGGGEHDWNRLLYSMHALQWDHQIGAAVWATGLLIILFSVGAGIYFSGGREERAT